MLEHVTNSFSRLQNAGSSMFRTKNWNSELRKCKANFSKFMARTAYILVSKTGF